MSDSLLSIVSPAPGFEGKTLLKLQDGTEWSYGRFFDHAGRLANTLRELGVKPGDRVAVQVEKSVDALALYVACVRGGFVYLPLNTAYTAAEVGYFVTDAEPSLLVCRPSFQAEAEALARGIGAAVATLGTEGDGTLLERAADQPERFTDRAAAPDDLAAILYTSGTTGRSKGAMMTRDNLASNAVALTRIWRFTADDVLLHALPIYHTHGLFVATNVVMRAGASMLFLPRFDAEQAIRLLPAATAMMGVPTFYTRLLDHPGLTVDLVRHMRLFVSGSAPLLASTHEEFAARTGHRILERYGMTETGMNTSNPYDGERIAGTVGFPLPDVEVRITDPESGAVLGPDEIGVIEVRGPNVFKGYWRMPEKTAAELRADGFFITGDVGKIDARGYVHIVGRAKDLIISGGFNVYPKEIELAIDALDGVKESAVFGIPHPDFGEAVAAAVVLEPGSALTGPDIQRALLPVLAKFKHPKHVTVMAELPRNTMGKVQKNVLRDAHAGLYAKP